MNKELLIIHFNISLFPCNDILFANHLQQFNQFNQWLMFMATLISLKDSKYYQALQWIHPLMSTI
jgi:hypothetical protein